MRLEFELPERQSKRTSSKLRPSLVPPALPLALLAAGDTVGTVDIIGDRGICIARVIERRIYLLVRML
jgi:hypothetical protein